MVGQAHRAATLAPFAAAREGALASERLTAAEPGQAAGFELFDRLAWWAKPVR